MSARRIVPVPIVARFVATSLAVAALLALLVGLVHAGEPGAASLTLAQAQVGPQKGGKAGTAESEDILMRRCMKTWDRATQMTKQEWRETCKRTVKSNPELYREKF